MTPDPRYTPVDLDLRPLGAFGRFFADYAWVAAAVIVVAAVVLAFVLYRQWRDIGLRTPRTTSSVAAGTTALFPLLLTLGLNAHYSAGSDVVRGLGWFPGSVVTLVSADGPGQEGDLLLLTDVAGNRCAYTVTESVIGDDGAGTVRLEPIASQCSERFDLHAT